MEIKNDHYEKRQTEKQLSNDLITKRVTGDIGKDLEAYTNRFHKGKLADMTRVEAFRFSIFKLWYGKGI